MAEHPLRQWLDANQHFSELVGLAMFDLEEAMAGRPVAQRHDLHLFCCVLAGMAADLSAVTATPSLVGAELAAEVYPIDGGRRVMTDVRRAALGAAVARIVGGSFAGSRILVAFYGVGAVAACPDPDNHRGIYESCDPAYGQMALHEVPAELQLLASVARQVTIIDEHRLPVPVRVDELRDRSIGIRIPAKAPHGLVEGMQSVQVMNSPRVESVPLSDDVEQGVDPAQPDLNDARRRRLEDLAGASKQAGPGLAVPSDHRLRTSPEPYLGDLLRGHSLNRHDPPSLGLM